MQAGRMNRVVSIDYKSVELDATYGTEIVTWLRLDTVWAEVQDAMPSRSESIRQGLESARNQTRIRMRWRNDIDSTMRLIVHGETDVVFQIVGGPAEIGGRKNGIEMMCERYSS